jgi:hypothetical protein
MELEKKADFQFKLKRFEVLTKVLKGMKGVKKRRGELK